MINIQQEVINGNINPYELLDLWNEKVLDREDIESLGWKLEDDLIGEITFQKHIDNISWWELDYELNNKYLSIEFCKINHNNLTDVYTYFRGTIKNKSELKVLMKQLGINE